MACSLILKTDPIKTHINIGLNRAGSTNQVPPIEKEKSRTSSKPQSKNHVDFQDPAAKDDGTPPIHIYIFQAFPPCRVLLSVVTLV